MKAAVYTKYGSPDVVQIMDVDKPVPNDGEVLIKVRAASVNPYDWHFMRGLPYVLRLMAGMRKPKDTRLGADVFGTCRGAFAQYARASESTLVMRPKNVTFEQAASAPIAALTALQGLRDKGHIQPGQRVLINGAAGGVGTFAVQIAKAFGADVTGVCSTRNVEMVQSIGANQVVDYTREDFTKSGQGYDIILDAVGNRSLSACRRVLNPKGILVMAGGTAGRWMIGPLTRGIRASVVSRFVRQQMVGILAKSNQQDLTVLGELMATGKVTPVIDRRYSLSKVPEAILYLEAGHARGKVVITF
jgi:NADPH:quinone reductase-like Zn-dependent oxidoreductase